MIQPTYDDYLEASREGPLGRSAYEIAFENAYDCNCNHNRNQHQSNEIIIQPTYDDYLEASREGPQGRSAYEIAFENAFENTQRTNQIKTKKFNQDESLAQPQFIHHAFFQAFIVLPP